jgi:hypothetical protein
MQDKQGVSVFATAVANRPFNELARALPPKTMAAFLNHDFTPAGGSSPVKVMDQLDAASLEACKPFAAQEAQPALQNAIAAKSGPEIN